MWAILAVHPLAAGYQHDVVGAERDLHHVFDGVGRHAVVGVKHAKIGRLRLA